MAFEKILKHIGGVVGIDQSNPSLFISTTVMRITEQILALLGNPKFVAIHLDRANKKIALAPANNYSGGFVLSKVNRGKDKDNYQGRVIRIPIWLQEAFKEMKIEPPIQVKLEEDENGWLIGELY